MTDPYADKYKKAIKDAKNSREVENVINKIYQDGFEDGANEG